MRKIRVITHGLTAAVNLTNAITASNRDLKTARYCIVSIISSKVFPSPPTVIDGNGSWDL